jgi:hypothetical protein
MSATCKNNKNIRGTIALVQKKGLSEYFKLPAYLYELNLLQEYTMFMENHEHSASIKVQNNGKEQSKDMARLQSLLSLSPNISSLSP